MIFSTNSLNRIFSVLLLVGFLLTGCAGKELLPSQVQIDAVDVVAEGRLAKIDSVRLHCSARGGQGGLSYAFQLMKDAIVSDLAAGGAPHWQWTPKEPGSYRFRAVVTDEAGTVAVSDWSEAFEFDAALNGGSLYAVLPVENLSDRKAPLGLIRERLVQNLTRAGHNILPEETLEAFMEKYRIRHTGGLSPFHSQQMREELGVDGVFISALETWHETTPPRVSLIARVVTTGPSPEIVWTDRAGRAGDEAPGGFGLRRIDEVLVLLDRGMERLLRSFQNHLGGRSPSFRHGADPNGVRLMDGSVGTADGALAPLKNHLLPRFAFRAPDYDPAQQHRVALVPFLNVNARKHAGKIVGLHLVKQLHRYENIRVFEPGWVRDILLKYRMIMQTGPSLAASDILANDKLLGADLIVSGKVFDYQDSIGESKVDFSMQVFDGDRREIVWTSRSYATGNMGVYFYNVGKIATAHGLASLMTHAAVQKLEADVAP